MIVLKLIALIAVIVVITSTCMVLVDNLSQNARRHDVAAMNRQIARYDNQGWLVLINVKKRVVGLYHNGYAVSHAKIKLGSSVLDAFNSGVCELTIGDFKEIDADIPRFSYRVLYEYKVPHETLVILY